MTGNGLPYLPPDAIILTEYNEVIDALRKLAVAPPHVSEAPFDDATLQKLTGPPHVKRRRIMNRLVRPTALDRYRDEITLPMLRRRLIELRSSPEPDGTYRTDLVQFLKRTFVEFAAELVAVHGGLSQESGDQLAELIDRMHLAKHAKWLHDDWTAVYENGIDAKQKYKDEFYEPWMAACPVTHGREANDERPDLVSLTAATVDEAWHDEEIALREAIVLLIASVDTSVNLLISAVDELHGWLLTHPEDRALVSDLEFLAKVIQEALRIHPPNPFEGRVAIEDTTLASGRLIKKGQFVAGLALAANTDKTIFGAESANFNPHRELPPSVPRYGVSFGAGEHQCLGLRVVLGNTGIGSHTYVLQTLFAAGIGPDPDRQPDPEASERGVFMHYPVIFSNINMANV